MQPTSYESSKQVIDINATYEKHVILVPNILAAHALTGCDTVGATFGIGKSSVIKVLKSNEVSLVSIGDLRVPFSDCAREGTQFILRCYGQKTLNSLNDARIKLWKNKIIK